MDHIRRLLVVRVVTVLAMASLLLAFPATTLAAGNIDCAQSGQANHWRGEYVSGGQKHGTSGTVANFGIGLCTNPDLVEIDGSFYFSNVEPSGGTFRDIVQVGFGRARAPTIYYNTKRNYIGWGRSTSTPGCSGFSNRNPLAYDVGDYIPGSHDYKVYHVSNLWRMYVDTNWEYQVGESSICWTPARSTWFAETWDSGDQLGGSASDHLKVTQMNYANAENGGFYWTSLNASLACNYNTDPPAAYKCDITGATSIEMWTSNR